MKHNGRTIRAVLAVGVFICIASAQGQVVPSQDGRMLDANPGLGSRYNAQVPQGLSVNSQLYVTGQVTGLSYFRGQTGYFAGDELQTNVPSSVLSNFNRQSVNLSQALGGQTYLTAPYYDRGQTVLGMNSILAGRAAPGSNVPISSVPSATSLGQQLYIDALAEYRMAQANRAGQTLMPELSRTLPQPRSTLGADGLGADSPAMAFIPISQTTLLAAPSLQASDLFGISRGKEQENLARELYIHAHAGEIRAQQELAAQGRKLDAGVPGASPLGQIDPGAEAKALDANQVSSQVTLGGPFQRPRGAPERNQDVFMDMLITVRRGQQDPNMPVVGAGGAGSSVTAGLVEWQGGRTVLIRSLAGESKDRFNIQMGRAGQQLRANKFYDAAFTYETASLQDSRNPLARVGRGLSLLGAGETLSASYEIERAMRLYPPLAQTRLDLPSMIAESIIRKQLSSLDERIETAGPEARQRLEFLATYLYYNDKQFDKAKSYAQRLVKSIQNESLIRSYAENVLADFKPKPAPVPPETTPETIQEPPEVE